MSLKVEYNSDSDSLIDDFFIPVVSNSISYDRMAAFFTSDSLSVTASGIAGLIKNGGHMRLLISQHISLEDLEAIESGYTDVDDYLINKYKNEIFDDNRIKNDTLEALGWMISQGKLDIHVVFVTFRSSIDEIDNSFIFHQKVGLMTDCFGNSLAFEGSINETAAAWIGNDESFHVYQSWIPIIDLHYDACRKKFEKYWNEGSTDRKHTKTVPFPKVLADEWILRVPQEVDDLKIMRGEVLIDSPISCSYDYSSLKKHQKRAFDIYMEEKKGIVSMATGTGKTRLALSIGRSLAKSGLIKLIVVIVPNNDLVEQWNDDLYPCFSDLNPIIVTINSSSDPNIGRISRYVHFGAFTIVCTRYSDYELFYPDVIGVSENTFVICDEVHNLGSEQKQLLLKGSIKPIQYRLGLSATPERPYDDAGTSFIQDELGPIIFNYGLKEALSDKVLCDYYYYPIVYELSAEERKSVQKLIGMIQKEDTSVSDEIQIRISNIYKTSKGKLEPFYQLIKSDNSILERSLIFVHSKEYGLFIQNIIMEICPTLSYKTYYGGEPDSILRDFSNGSISCLITAKRISEGVSINDINTVILLSTARSDTETLQRVGRALRKNPNDPNKVAVIVDFLETNRMKIEHSSDNERYLFLSDLAKEVIQ